MPAATITITTQLDAGPGLYGSGYVKGQEQNENGGSDHTAADIIGLMGPIHGFKLLRPAVPQNFLAMLQIILQFFLHVHDLLSMLSFQVLLILYKGTH